MKKFLCVAILLYGTQAAYAVEKKDDVAVEVRAQEGVQPSKMRLLIGAVGGSAYIEKIAELLARDFSCMHQKKNGFDVGISRVAKKPTPKEIYQIFVHQGYPFELLVYAAGNNIFEWQLWDTLQGSVIKRNRVAYTQEKFENAVHQCADEIWKELTGQEGIFSTVIAYCKQIGEGKKQVRHVYAVRLGGADPLRVIDTPSNKLALRWHSSSQEPTLFYSEHTPVNVRLVSIPFFKNGKDISPTLISNFNGLNMQPSFADNGKKTVMCASCLGSSQLYYGIINEQTQKWKFHRITYNNGNNIAPILRDNGDIIFCSDFEFNRPQIYYYHGGKGSIERLTEGSYTASPAWCEQKQALAYVKNVKGVMQLFVYDRQTKVHTQLTTDARHKEEPTWSPAGTYVAYSAGDDVVNRIAVRNLITNEEFYLTSDAEYCCYPAWSPHIAV